MKNPKLLVLLLITLLLVPQLAVAQYGGYGYNIGGYDPLKIIFGPEIDQSWYEPYHTLQYLVFPFIAIWMIIYGLFSEVRIFRTKESIQFVLALVIALIASSTGGLVTLVRVTLQFLGGFSVLAFAVVFGVGVFFWGWGTIGMHRGAKNLNKQYQSEMERIDNEIGRLEVIWGDTVVKEPKRAHEIREKMDRMYARKREIQQAYHDYL